MLSHVPLLIVRCHFKMGARQRSGKASKSKETSNDVKIKATTPKPEAMSLWQKVFAKDEQLTPRETLKAAHWMRQLIGIIIGILFGVMKFTGAPAIMSFLLTTVMTPPAFLGLFNELDLDEINDESPMQAEGIMPSFALFLLTWIVTYTIGLPAEVIEGR